MGEMKKGSGDMKEVCEIRHFQNAPGMRIKVLTPVDVKTQEPLSETEERKRFFMGTVTLVSPAGPHEMQFPIDAASLEEAFEKFEDTARAAAAEIQKQSREQIVKAKTLPPGMEGREGNIIQP